MNHISFEIKIRAEDKEKFLMKNRQRRGPFFREFKTSVGYHKDDKKYASYYAKDWDNEVILYTSVSICVEDRLIDLLDDISDELNIDLKYISSYQPDETEDASGAWGYFKRRIKAMTRKEMIELIAQQAGCSKRLVRKKLFAFSSELKSRWNLNLTEPFLNKDTKWFDFYEIHDAWKRGDKTINPWKTKNSFKVVYVPSGCVVMFNLERIINGNPCLEIRGTRLYSY